MATKANQQVNNGKALKTDEKISIKDMVKLIPKKCFQKDLSLSLYYMIRDLALLSTAFWSYQHLNLFIFCNIYGFIMWCVFVIGHDCGHGSFSDNDLINSICGHICHSVLCVPFWSWAYSHSLHHQYHQHIGKDKSHPWYPRKQYAGKTLTWGEKLENSPTTPIWGFFAYLYMGFDDGSHIIPTSKLFAGNTKQAMKCAVSTICVAVFVLIMVFMVFNGNLYMFLKYYGGCWIVFSFWLFMVTYFQHHGEHGTIAYDDNTWDYVSGALETVDRTYGYGIDDFHHNISDCHVVHHLFYTKIPHYHLTEATNAIKPFLISQNRYKHVTHSNVVIDFLTTFWTHAYTADVVSK